MELYEAGAESGHRQLSTTTCYTHHLPQHMVETVTGRRQGVGPVAGSGGSRGLMATRKRSRRNGSFFLSLHRNSMLLIDRLLYDEAILSICVHQTDGGEVSDHVLTSARPLGFSFARSLEPNRSEALTFAAGEFFGEEARCPVGPQALTCLATSMGLPAHPVSVSGAPVVSNPFLWTRKGGTIVPVGKGSRHVGAKMTERTSPRERGGRMRLLVRANARDRRSNPGPTGEA